MVLHTRRLPLFAAGALALISGCSQLDSTAPSTIAQGPAGDAFYTPPALTPGQHGDLI
ncbi:hypothetical protein [Pseudomonas sp. GV071]|uniref:hypothetical protein n=1 Tax=Pseudomonas sp. GV071 TaxID=2135754 RepID=UPI000D4E9519|nr:hypothetical protein [Pseudomonas sp. GV071]PTQ69904.1 hypothetical protein C8K61_107115 [Pseudomonas sp. GV071]